MTSNNLNYIALLFILLTVGCSSNTPEDSKEEVHEEETNVVELTDAQIQTGGVEMGPVEDKQISGTIKVNGKLDVPPQQLVSISTPLGGFLKTTPLLQGSKVKKGQSIATIENLEFIQIQQDYLEAKSQLELSKADFERQEQLAKDNVNSQKTLQQSKNTFVTWQARSNGLKEKLRVVNIDPASVENGAITSTIELRSPISGYVTEININVGKFAAPTDVLFEIVDPEHLHAELTIFEKDVTRVKIGQKVRFSLADERKERLATVYLVGREIAEDRTIRIHCHIDDEDNELMPGMYLTGLVEIGGKSVPAVPDAAVVDYRGVKYVFVENESDEPAAKNFTMVEVTVGDTELGFTEISLPEEMRNKKIVIKGAYALLSKLKNSADEHDH